MANDEVKSAGAARILGITPAAVRLNAKAGKLRFTMRDGVRYFRLRDLEAFRAKRESLDRRRKRPAAA